MNLEKQKCILFVVLLMTLLFSLAIVNPSNAKDYSLGSTAIDAFLSSAPPVGDMPGIPVVIAGEPKKTIMQKIGGVLSRAVWAGAEYAVNYAAYKTAAAIASGAMGEKPLWLTTSDFYTIVDGAAGEAIYTLGDNVDFLKKYGISLCVPPDLKLQLWLQLNMAEAWQPPAPHCSLKQVKAAWQEINPFSDNFNSQRALSGIGVGFRPGQNDLSMLLAANQAVKEIGLRKKEEAKEALTYRGTTVAPINVAGQAKTPVTYIDKLIEEFDKGNQQIAMFKTQSTADAFDRGDLWSALGNLGKLFANKFGSTLASKLMEKALNKGFISLADLVGGDSSETAASSEAQVVGGRQAAEIAFAEFLKPNLPAVEQWNYTGELASDCSIKSPYCGVLDNGFADALTQADLGEAVTVKEALAKGYLRGEWNLLPPNSDCPREAYCYENLVKLRQLRILPIGWELAAKASSADKPTSLQKAVDAFSAPATNNPFYHLIDPYWILKAPVAKCGAMAYSANFILPPAMDGTGGQRGEYCADVQNCVEEDEAGQCNQGSWGYCLKEKNRWILGGDSCDAQFNTCTTYANSQGQTASYLANTIEKSICNADNVGCRAYAVSSDLKNDKWEWNLAQSAQKIYFNAKAAQCDYSNEGCSQFVRTGFGLVGGAEVSYEKVNLKKAPEYYNCYGEAQADTKQFSSSTVPWAVNKADLSKIFDSWKSQNKEKCDNFAQVCSYDEVGCEKYTPTNGDLPIPGILTANDQCPSACIGYESFKQQDTNFETAPTEWAYFIPSTAVSCQEPEAGCDEFVNLEAQTAGGEGKEYYTELRQCSQTEVDGAVYYTWEGSDTAGYQLKSFNLKKSANGSPVSTIILNDNSANPDANTCGVNSYKDKKADPDCREFYDKDGNKSYRLYTKTITVSAADCKKLRKTVSDKISCENTGGVWDTKVKDSCVYLAIPKEGVSCKAAAVGCRAYKGNAGNNFYALPDFPITFESGAVGGKAKDITGWDGTFSAESTVVGGKSLKVGNGYTGITTSLIKGTTYSLSFWAKGLGDGLKVSVKPTDANGAPKTGVGTDIVFNVPLHADWQNYTVGPIVIDWDESAASSTARFESGKVFYLDNIVAKQMSGNIYVVKNSWKTPSACDNLIGDEYGQSQGGSFTNPYRLVPQAMLGCQKYTDRQNQEVAVKSFTSMCREEAVGCEEFVDTRNSASPISSFVNLLCKLDSINTSNQAIECKDNNNETRCSVSAGSQECRFTFMGDEMALDDLTDDPDGAAQDALGKQYKIEIKNDEQTIEIKADSKEYLVNDKNFYCANDALGCSALGAINYSGVNSAQAQGTAYLKNQPDLYGQTLCEKAAEGCEEFKTSQGAAYFKDPGVKNNFCEYNNDINGSGVAGWVKKDLGSCEGLSAEAILACSSDADCQKVGNKKCNKDKKVSCTYPGVDNVLFKNGDPDYDGMVGLCPAEQNGCSEFIDPKDTSALHPNGTPYFVINNSKLDKSSCGNQASVQEGCILFDETSKGTANWSAARTYIKSEKNNNTKVNLVDCGSKGEKTSIDNPDCLDTNFDANNANTILKVQRDRVCGEWLACKSSMSVRDDTAAGGWKEMCTELAPCLEANSEATTLTGKCGKWADDSNELFTVDKYQKRFQAKSWSWEVLEYSGYTLPEAYQISALSVAGKTLANQVATPKEIFTNKGAIAQSCRGFAQSDTPDGMCSYTKVTYSAQNSEPITRYLPYNQLLGADGVCSSGFDELSNSKKGLSCVHSGNCTDDRPLNPAEMAFAIKEHGVCMMPQQPITKSRGWEGYCLDPAALSAGNDIASGAKQSPKNCTLWYPLTTPSGSISSDHLYASAGYVPPSGSGKYWCVQAKGNANIANTTSAFSYAYTAYQDARQFYPHTAKGFNGNVCKSGDQVFGGCFNKDGQSSCTCPGELNTYLSYTTAAGKKIINHYDDSDYTKTQEVGSELITKYDKEPLHISEVAAIGLIATGDYYSNDGYYDDTWPVNPLYVFRDQRLAGIENIKDDELDGRYWSGPLKKFGSSWVMDLTWTVGNKPGGRAEEINYDAITEAVCAKKLSVDSEAAAMGFRAYFDADGQLKKIGTKICDAGKYASGMQMDLVFYLSEVCTDIRQVVDTDSEAAIDSPMGFLAKGRTDRLALQSLYKVGADLVEKKIEPRLDLAYNQIFAPFGSFSQSQNPVTSTLTEYTKQFKTSYAQRNALNQAGMWPIWTMPGGGTPLSCAKDNKGDCGQVALCQSGPQKGVVCDPDEDKNENGEADDPGYPEVCEWHPLATCDFSGVKECIGGKIGSSCSSNPDCNDSGKNNGVCQEINVCSDGPKKGLECGYPKETNEWGVEKEEHNGGDWCNNFTNGNYYITKKDGVVQTNIEMEKLILDCQDCKIKEETKNDETNSYVAYKCSFSNTRGLCVGGQNHGQFCGGNLDCPPKKHSDSTEDTTEYGLCVGAALDEGKVIPKNDPTGHGFGRGLERLLELFPAWFNTWEWLAIDNRYSLYSQDKNKGNSDNWASFKNQGDYTFAKQEQFSQGGNCGVLYPKEGCNPKANVDPSSPKIYSLKLKDSAKPDNGFTWGKVDAFTVNGFDSDSVPLSSGASTAILRFYAYADHDQMPLVRLAVDWEDGSDPYVMQGWFKNRKPYCQTEKFQYCNDGTDTNKPCKTNDDCGKYGSTQITCGNKPDTNRLYFGNSLDACEEGYYQFTHIYECKSGGVGWDASAKSCKFTPKVQALDNWGWCNSADGKGKWNDNIDDETKKNCRTNNDNVGTGKNNPWTFFSSTIEVKP